MAASISNSKNFLDKKVFLSVIFASLVCIAVFYTNLLQHENSKRLEVIKLFDAIKPVQEKIEKELMQNAKINESNYSSAFLPFNNVTYARVEANGSIILYSFSIDAMFVFQPHLKSDGVDWYCSSAPSYANYSKCNPWNNKKLETVFDGVTINGP